MLKRPCMFALLLAAIACGDNNSSTNAQVPSPQVTGAQPHSDQTIGDVVTTTCNGTNNFCLAAVGTGNQSGDSCTNAKPYRILQHRRQLGEQRTRQIIPGSTQTICGTISFPANTVGLTFQADGTAGNPITLKFSDNAIVQAPYFPHDPGRNGCGGGICMNTRSYVVTDGGTNGILQNTANGTLLANQKPTLGIDMARCDELHPAEFDGPEYVQFGTS